MSVEKIKNPPGLAIKVGRNFVDTLFEVALRLSMPIELVRKMAKNGMPRCLDGRYNIDDIKTWREDKLTDRKEVIARESYEENKIEFLGKVEAKIIDKVNQILMLTSKKELVAMDAYKKITSVRDLVNSYVAIHSANRLEKGESTQNIGVIFQMVKEAKKKRKEENGASRDRPAQ